MFKLPAAVSGDSYAITIEMAPERVVIRGDGNKKLDEYGRPNRAEPPGRFGFKGEVTLALKSAEER